MPRLSPDPTDPRLLYPRDSASYPKFIPSHESAHGLHFVPVRFAQATAADSSAHMTQPLGTQSLVKSWKNSAEQSTSSQAPPPCIHTCPPLQNCPSALKSSAQVGVEVKLPKTGCRHSVHAAVTWLQSIRTAVTSLQSIGTAVAFWLKPVGASPAAPRRAMVCGSTLARSARMTGGRSVR